MRLFYPRTFPPPFTDKKKKNTRVRYRYEKRAFGCRLRTPSDARPRRGWQHCGPSDVPRVYFRCYSSYFNFVPRPRRFERVRQSGIGIRAAHFSRFVLLASSLRPVIVFVYGRFHFYTFLTTKTNTQSSATKIRRNRHNVILTVANFSRARAVLAVVRSKITATILS